MDGMTSQSYHDKEGLEVAGTLMTLLDGVDTRVFLLVFPAKIADAGKTKNLVLMGYGNIVFYSRGGFPEDEHEQELDCSARYRMSHSSRLMLHMYSNPLRQLDNGFMSGFTLYSFDGCYFNHTSIDHQAHLEWVPPVLTNV